MIQRAAIDDFQLIRVFFKQSLPAGIQPQATLDPPVPVAWTEVVTAEEDARRSGYLLSRGMVTFIFDQGAYGLELARTTQVVVAGNFTGWDGGGGGGKWVLKRGRLAGTWEAWRRSWAGCGCRRAKSWCSVCAERHGMAHAAGRCTERAGGRQGKHQFEAGYFAQRRREIRVHTAEPRWICGRATS